MKFKKRIVLGITGGIASGKTTALNILSRLGIPIISSDALARNCVSRGTSSYRQIVKHFGQAVLQKSGELNRQALGRIVFAHPQERKRLEKMVHPCVLKGLKHFINTHKGVIALDIPLLYEARMDSLVDRVVVVYCPRKMQIQRLMKRNGFSRQEALRRLSAQFSIEEKRRRADIVLDNSGALKALRQKIYAQIIKKIS